MKSIPVPKPSLDAHRYYNTFLFHGYFRAFVTFCLLLSGGWMFFASGSDAATRSTVKWLHVAFGLFGVYLTLFHLAGYLTCAVMKLERVQEARKNMADTGWILLALMALSVGTGAGLIFGDSLSQKTRGYLVQGHVFAAIVYPAMSIVHFWYYWRHWKPALRGDASRRKAAPAEE